MEDGEAFQTAVHRPPAAPPSNCRPLTVEALAGPDERTPEDKPAEEIGAPEQNIGDPVGVRMTERGIIEVTIPPNQLIEGPEARVAAAAVRSLAHGRRLPMLLVITGVVGVSVEARHVYATSIAASAFALVGESPVDRVIAHYLLRSKTETVPAQFFTSESEAVEWLGQYARGD
jgi:hypothetical protein